jgi:hypothetical protein
VDEEMKFKMNDRERQEKGERRILKEVKMKMNGRKRQEVGTTK